MSLRNKKLAVKRFSTGGYNENTGRWEEDSSPEEFTIKASLQPMTGEDLEALPEGKRAEAGYWIFTSTKLKTVQTDGSDQNPDIVVIFEEEFEAVTLKRWRNNIINHYQVGVVRVAS